MKQTDTITPFDFGAKGDGIADDIVPIEKAERYAMDMGAVLHFPNNRFRISRQWVIGYKYIKESDYDKTIVADLSVIDDSKIPLEITSGNMATIFGDFDCTELTAVVYYCILPWRKQSEEIVPSFSNLKIEGKPGSNQIGFMAVDAYNLKVDGLRFKNLNKGAVSNSCYFSNWQNLVFWDCKAGFYSKDMNCSKVSNLNCFRSDVAYNFGGVAMVIEVLSTQSCNVFLDLNGSFNTIINSCYFENVLEVSERFAIVANNTDGVTINNGIFSATTGSPSWGAINLLSIGVDCGRLKLNDCTGSGNITNRSSALTADILGNYKNIQGTIN